MDKFREPEQFDAEVEIHDGEPFAVWAPAVNGSHVKAEVYFALLAELEASKKSNAFLKEQLAKLANFNPDWDMLEACRDSWREVAAALNEAEAKLEAKDNRIGELERILDGVTPVMIAGGWTAKGISDYAKSLEAKLATPVRLTDERTLWAGEDDYDTGHVKGWNANRIEQSALLKKQGFTVEGDE